MVDTLLHHYQRLWRAEATQEILNTRPSHVKKPSSMMGRNYGSLNNLSKSPYLPGNGSLVPKSFIQPNKSKVRKLKWKLIYNSVYSDFGIL